MPLPLESHHFLSLNSHHCFRHVVYQFPYIYDGGISFQDMEYVHRCNGVIADWPLPEPSNPTPRSLFPEIDEEDSTESSDSSSDDEGDFRDSRSRSNSQPFTLANFHTGLSGSLKRKAKVGPHIYQAIPLDWIDKRRIQPFPRSIEVRSLVASKHLLSIMKRIFQAFLSNAAVPDSSQEHVGEGGTIDPEELFVTFIFCGTLLTIPLGCWNILGASLVGWASNKKTSIAWNRVSTSMITS